MEIHLNDILRVHYHYRNSDGKIEKNSPYKFSIDMLVIYDAGNFYLVNLETGMVFVKFPHEKKWTLNKLRLYINQNHDELLPIHKIERLGDMLSRL